MIFQSFLVYLVLPILSIPPVRAVVGTVDTNNRFPYVVRLSFKDIGYCSSAVSADNLVTTAAHCVWDDENWRLYGNQRIVFTDIHGEEKSVGIRRAFVPDKYKDPRYKGKALATMSHARTVYDFAILIPDEAIELNDYAHWITDVIDWKYLHMVGCEQGGDQPCVSPRGEALEYLRELVDSALGGFMNSKSLVVGYGGHGCEKFDGDCKVDDKLRFSEAKLQNYSDLDIPFPLIWCNGPNEMGFSPVRNGDSGGPHFVRTWDERWLYVGNTSAGNDDHSCSSSLLANLDLWRKVLNSEAYANRPAHSSEWYAKQTERTVAEFFRSLSSPPKIAAEYLSLAYSGIGKDENGNVINDGGLRDHGSGNVENYKNKMKFIERWRERSMRVKSISTEQTIINPRRNVPGDFHTAKGIVSWHVRDPSTGEERDGESEFEFVVVTARIELDQISSHMAGLGLIYEEDFTPSLGSLQDFDMAENVSLNGEDYDNFKNVEFRGCQRLCKTDDRCAAFSYVQSSSWCWLKSSVPSANSKSGIISGVKDGRGTIPKKFKMPVNTYKLLSNFSIDGGDYRNFKGEDFNTCRQTCDEESECVAFSYAEKNRSCWLKSGVPSSSLKSGVSSGYKIGKVPLQPTMKFANFFLYNNVSIDGGDYNDYKGVDLNTCRLACVIDNKCTAFSFIEKSSWCWLKSSYPALSLKGRVVSGIKEK